MKLFPKKKIRYLVASPPTLAGTNNAGTGYQNPVPALLIVIFFYSSKQLIGPTNVKLSISKIQQLD